MKKAIAVLLVLTVAVLLCACTSRSAGDSETPSATDVTSVQDQTPAADSSEETASSGDGQNPVMNFIGNYVCERASASVACSGRENARITITWGGSADSAREWVIDAKLDTETLTVAYTDAVVTDYVYNPDGSVNTATEVSKTDKGTVTFTEDGKFTWDDDLNDGLIKTFEYTVVVV